MKIYVRPIGKRAVARVYNVIIYLRPIGEWAVAHVYNVIIYLRPIGEWAVARVYHAVAETWCAAERVIGVQIVGTGLTDFAHLPHGVRLVDKERKIKPTDYKYTLLVWLDTSLLHPWRTAVVLVTIWFSSTKLTLSLSKVINFKKYSLQPRQKYNITQYEELGFP